MRQQPMNLPMYSTPVDGGPHWEGRSEKSRRSWGHEVRGTEIIPHLHAGVVIVFRCAAVNTRTGGGIGIIKYPREKAGRARKGELRNQREDAGRPPYSVLD